jgi:hypothetical protein
VIVIQCFLRLLSVDLALSRLLLSVAMFAARAALRSPALRRGIHTGRTSNSARSSFALSGAVLVAGGAAYAAYYSWDLGTRSRRIKLEEAGKVVTAYIFELVFLTYEYRAETSKSTGS